MAGHRLSSRPPGRMLRLPFPRLASPTLPPPTLPPPTLPPPTLRSPSLRSLPPRRLSATANGIDCIRPHRCSRVGSSSSRSWDFSSRTRESDSSSSSCPKPGTDRRIRYICWSSPGSSDGQRSPLSLCCSSSSSRFMSPGGCIPFASPTKLSKCDRGYSSAPIARPDSTASRESTFNGRSSRASLGRHGSR